MKGIHLDITAEDAKKIFILLISFELLLTIFYIGHTYLRYPAGVLHELVDMDGETSIPTWFATLLLFLTGLLLLLFSRQRTAGVPPSSRFFKLGGLGFIFLSMDEAVMFHENITRVLAPIDWIPRFPGDHGIWVPVYIGIGLVLAPLFYADILAMWKLFRQETLIILAGVGIFLAGALAIEVLSYYIFENRELKYLLPVEEAVEEFLEMVGISTLLYGVVLLAGRRQAEAVPSGSAQMKAAGDDLISVSSGILDARASYEQKTMD